MEICFQVVYQRGVIINTAIPEHSFERPLIDVRRSLLDRTATEKNTPELFKDDTPPPILGAWIENNGGLDERTLRRWHDDYMN